MHKMERQGSGAAQMALVGGYANMVQGLHSRQLAGAGQGHHGGGNRISPASSLTHILNICFLSLMASMTWSIGDKQALPATSSARVLS